MDPQGRTRIGCSGKNALMLSWGSTIDDSVRVILERARKGEESRGTKRRIPGRLTMSDTTEDFGTVYRPPAGDESPEIAVWSKTG